MFVNISIKINSIDRNMKNFLNDDLDGEDPMGCHDITSYRTGSAPRDSVSQTIRTLK